MAQASPRFIAHSSLVLAVLLTAAGLIISTGAHRTALAQETLECAPPTAISVSPATGTAAATPAADSAPVPFPAEGGDLTVLAAASLTAAFERIESDLEAANPDLGVTFNFAGSQTLVTQLAEGADADLFASANNTQMANAVEAGVIAGEPRTFTQNRLTIIVPADNPAGIESPADLANDGLVLVLAAPEVPVGQYAREAACKMAADPATYGDDFLGGFAGNIVSNEDNVKAVVTKVQLGEADAGVVYTTDVTADVAAEIIQIELPAPVNVVATYPIAAVAGGNAALADAFIAYLLSPDGQATLQEFGFDPRS